MSIFLLHCCENWSFDCLKGSLTCTKKEYMILKLEPMCLTCVVPPSLWNNNLYLFEKFFFQSTTSQKPVVINFNSCDQNLCKVLILVELQLALGSPLHKYLLWVTVSIVLWFDSCFFFSCRATASLRWNFP